MFRAHPFEKARSLFKNRYADEWVGLLVVVSVVLFAAAVAEAGFLKQWLTPERRIHFVLPENGVAGLAVGNDIEVMGVHAGEIRHLDLNSKGTMYAEGSIEPQFVPFIRQDSSAVIRHRFVVAGASYIELGRGRGPDLDWEYAVLNATVEANPADVITQTVSDVRAALVPTLENAQKITGQLNAMVSDMRAGKGSVGALLSKDDTIRQADEVLAHLNDVLARVEPLEKQLGGVMTNVNGTVTNAHVATDELRKSMPQIRQTIGHANDSTAQLPALLTQAEATANSLRKLTDQLRGLWILGGSGGRNNTSHRLPAEAVRP